MEHSEIVVVILHEPVGINPVSVANYFIAVNDVEREGLQMISCHGVLEVKRLI